MSTKVSPQTTTKDTLAKDATSQASMAKPSLKPTIKLNLRADSPKKKMTLLFDNENYILMATGVALIFIGFLLMSGGKSPNPHEFNYAEIYSFRRITLAPIVILIGFGVEIFAIMKKPKDSEVIE